MGWEDSDDWEVLEAVDENGKGLTPWEIDFVEGAWKTLEDPKRGFLTIPQRKTIEKIATDRIP